ncbi:ThiF family protein [Methanobacterium formicicum]|uniref:ThiF family protein n=1 Tax=Methanobacterium formicicum TaxID=2162 RepID=A0A089ZIC0_METFO|nr:ThiF family adenylyltransferase [Methanobacterium formicicum]AIS32353.1 ThiF family protein [Methanobacterium formicicum]
MQRKEVADELKRARRALDGGIKEVKILEDWQWNQRLEKWFIKINITIDTQGKIPANSIWYVVVDDIYPKGIVKIYPDINGCYLTFEHQSNNGDIEKNGLWRKGSPCLDSPLKCLAKYDYDPEPINSDERLFWNVKRLIKWIRAANNNKLINNGDPFELPEFKIDSTKFCVFSENELSFMRWESVNNKFGIVKLALATYNSNPSIYFIKKFTTCNGEIIPVNWGKYLSQNFKSPITAIWIILNEIPVVNERQAPNTLGELFKACKKQGIDLLNIIEKIVENIRKEKEHILLLGFPIPKTVGDKNSVIYWQAIKLPTLSQRKHTARGYRHGKDGRWRRDVNEILLPKKKCHWFKSQNWNMDEINNRGQLIMDITTKKVLIIGSGTLGASVAELLVRSGVTNISIMDNDEIEIGNLSRHPLGLMQIGKSKSEEMSFFLNQINPHADVKHIKDEFKLSDKITEQLENFDLIIDCTSEDIVLDDLEQINFSKEKIFVSISIGYKGEKLFLFLQKGKKFKKDNFMAKIFPWLEKEKDKFSNEVLPRDGTGCWSSVFPARYDDILIASSTSIKVIENFIENNNKELISIYEQYSSEGIFVGYKKIE